MKLDATTDETTIRDVIAAYPYFPWIDFFNKVLPESVRVNEDEVVVVSSMLFEYLDELLRSTPKRTLANYLMWRVVKYSSDYANDALRRKMRAFNSVVGRVKPREPRSTQCTKATMES